MKLFLRNFLIFFFILIFAFSGVCVQSSAEEEHISFDQRNVLDDLSEMEINGKKFSLEDYGFNSEKDLQVINFSEFCYSSLPEKQYAYALYVYIYNPKNLDIDVSSSLNYIQFSVGDDNISSYDKYHLIYLNKSESEDINGLFYKFKVYLTTSQKETILKNVDGSKRVYKVSGFELKLLTSVDVKEYSVSETFNFTGYSKGFAPDNSSDSSLVMHKEVLTTLSLAVHPTSFRPKGTDGRTNYTQDSLHSVYFAVPNSFFDDYGTLSAVHCEWLNAVTVPGLVTGNNDFLNAVEPYVGKNFTYAEELKYTYLGAHSKVIVPGWAVAGPLLPFPHYIHNFDLSFNLPERSLYVLDSFTNNDDDDRVNPLYLLLDSGDAENSADTFYLTSAGLRQKMLDLTNIYGGELVNETYSRCLFSSVDDKYTEMTISSSDKYDLTSVKYSDKTFKKLFQTLGWVDMDVEHPYYDISALHKVSASDFTGSDIEIANRLLVAESDVSSLKAFYNGQKENFTVFLFRYQASKYLAEEATLFEKREREFGRITFRDIREIDTNAYFFQETVNLDFDIIDVTFYDGDVETVVPVLQNPIDFFPGLTPPVNTNDDPDDPYFWLRLILCLVLLIFLLIILDKLGMLKFVVKLFVWLFKAVIWILLLPFRLIALVVRKIKNNRSVSGSAKSNKRKR